MTHMRAPNNIAVVRFADTLKSSGKRKMQPNTSIRAMESLRPSLSTIIADKSSPGSSTI
jgi:hypothetical protein